MWLKDDIEELKNNWKQSSWWIKVWMAVSMFLAVSSFASLSQTIADWKGFFLDAIVFYREWVSAPVRAWASQFGVRYTQKAADVIVLCLTIAAICLRAYALDTDWDSKVEKRSFFSVVFLVVSGLVYTSYQLANNVDVTAYKPIWIVLMAIYLKSVATIEERDSRLILIQTIFVVLVVGILGAVSSGLSSGMERNAIP